MKKKLTIEEQLMLLAYGAMPSIIKFVESHPDLPEPLRMHATYVYFCTVIITEQKRCDNFMHQKVDKIFSAKEMGEFFDSLMSSNSDDPRDLRLITDLVKSFHKFTDSGMETYADFVPFTSFKHGHWLELIIRIQKSSSTDEKLKKATDKFIGKGLRLILHPALQEFGVDALNFFSWFEKLEFHGAKELVTSAVNVWKMHEKDESYNISDDDDEKSWYEAALKFSIQISSKEHVSKVFAENFKNDYPEIYEKFKLLVGLDDYDIVAATSAQTLGGKEAAEIREAQKLFGQYTHTVDNLVEIISQDARVKLLASIIFEISTNIADSNREHLKQTLVLLIEKHANCELVKELTSRFTQNLEKKIAEDSLKYADLPPSPLYISDEDWHWLF